MYNFTRDNIQRALYSLTNGVTMTRLRKIETAIAIAGVMFCSVNYISLATWIRIIARGCIIGGCGAGGWDGNGYQ